MKIPKIIQLPSGNWFCRLRLGGTSIPITCESETECIRVAELIKAEYNAGKTHVQRTPKETTLRNAIAKYIADKSKTLSPSTLRSYKIYADNRFADYMDKKLPQIKWQRMIDDEIVLTSEKTVKNAWALVSASLEHVGYPKPKVTLAKTPVPDLNFLQPDEIKLFCADIKGRSYEIPALLALHGLRLSELRALDWKNVDLKNKTMFIQGARVRGPDGEVDKKTNKNSTSSRYVPILIPQLETALKVVNNKTGRVVSIGANTLLDDVKRSCKRADVTICTTHDLRRSFASLCFFLQIPSKQIQEWGGWKDDVVLNKIYIKLSTASRTESKDKFTKFFESDNKKSAEENSPAQS